MLQDKVLDSNGEAQTGALPEAKHSPKPPQSLKNSTPSPHSQSASPQDTHTNAHHTNSGEPVLYHTPTALYSRTDEQVPRHADWGDLFFDVIYVGVCYQAGSLLVGKTDGKYTITGYTLALFLGTFWCLYYGWESRLHHKAHLRVEDRFHAALYVLQGLLIAVATRSLDQNIDKTSSNSLALIFSAAMLAHCTIDLGIVLEVTCLSKHRATRLHAARHAVPASLVRVAFLVASVVSVFFEGRFTATLLLWGGSYVVPSMLRFWTTVLTKQTDENSIGFDTAYVIQRYGEWTMLVLGEGVIQIVLASASYDMEYFGNVASSYTLMAFLQLLHYSINPFVPVDHALRKSGARGVLWQESQLIYNTFLLLIGVTMKLGFKDKTLGFDWFLCSFTAASVVILFCQRLLHLGLRKELGLSVLPVRQCCSSADGSGPCAVGKSCLCFRFSKGFQQKRIWVSKVVVAATIVLVPLFGIDESRTGLITLVVNAFLLAIIIFQVISGAFKRDRKLTATLATVKAVAKFKGLLTKAKEVDTSEKSGGKVTVDDADTATETETDLKQVVEGEEGEGSTKHLPSTHSSSGNTVYVAGKQLTNRAKNHGKAKVQKIKTVFDRVKGMNLYSVPANQVDWENLENDHETDWADLFFDLSYVALLLKLGNICTSGFLTDYAVHIEVWLFVALFIASYDCWISKSYYSSSVTATDFFHKALDIIEGLLVTLLAASIPETLAVVEVKEDDGHHRLLAEDKTVDERSFALAFASIRLLTQLVYVVRFGEIAYAAPDDNPGLQAFGKQNGRRQWLSIIPTVLSFIPASFLTSDDDRSELLAITVLFWMLGFVIKSGVVGYSICRRQVRNENTIPIHLEVYLHRYGEWVILMFGVCVLSLIIKSEDNGSSSKKALEEWVVFVCSFLVVSLYRKLHCLVERFNPSCHAARFSRVRGWTWGICIAPLSLAILGIGYSLAAIEADYHRVWETSDLFWAFAGSSAIYLETLWFLDWLHVGPDEWVFVSKHGRYRRAAVLCVKCLVIPAVYFAFPATSVAAYIILLVAIAQAVLAGQAHRMHARQRKREHKLLQERISKNGEFEGLASERVDAERSRPCLARQSSLSPKRAGVMDENVVEDDGEGGVLVDL